MPKSYSAILARNSIAICVPSGSSHPHRHYCITMLCCICNVEYGKCGWGKAQWQRQQCDLDDSWTVGCKHCRMLERPWTMQAVYHIQRADEYWNLVCNMRIGFAAWEHNGFLSVQHALAHKTQCPANLGHVAWAVVRSLVCFGEPNSCQCDGGRMEAYVQYLFEIGADGDAVALNAFGWHLWRALKCVHVTKEKIHSMHTDKPGWTAIRGFVWGKCGWQE